MNKKAMTTAEAAALAGITRQGWWARAKALGVTPDKVGPIVVWPRRAVNKILKAYGSDE